MQKAYRIRSTCLGMLHLPLSMLCSVTQYQQAEPLHSCAWFWVLFFSSCTSVRWARGVAWQMRSSHSIACCHSAYRSTGWQALHHVCTAYCRLRGFPFRCRRLPCHPRRLAVILLIRCNPHQRRLTLALCHLYSSYSLNAATIPLVLVA